MRRAAVLLAALALAACDTGGPSDAVTFQGVEVEAVGDAQLEVVGGRLVVSGLEGGREGGFAVAGTPDRVDVLIEPLAVPAGARFGSEATAAGVTAAELYVEGQADGSLEFLFDFGGVLDLATVQYLLGGEVLLEFQLDVLQRSAGARRAQSAGTGDGESGSTHVVRENGRYVVVADSDSDGTRRASGCAGFLMTPPANALAPDGTPLGGTVCADEVRVEPFTLTPMPVAEVAVRARGVGQFVVRQLDAE